MRPRLLHLGYIRFAKRLNSVWLCFNEAEAFTPRIPHRLAFSPSIRWRFNEAEAFTPRIRTWQLVLRRGISRASMRPRLLHLGYGEGVGQS